MVDSVVYIEYEDNKSFPRLCVDKNGLVVLFKSECCGTVVSGRGIGKYACDFVSCYNNLVWRRLTSNEKITLSNVN